MDLQYMAFIVSVRSRKIKQFSEAIKLQARQQQFTVMARIAQTLVYFRNQSAMGAKFVGFEFSRGSRYYVNSSQLSDTRPIQEKIESFADLLRSHDGLVV